MHFQPQEQNQQQYDVPHLDNLGLRPLLIQGFCEVFRAGQRLYKIIAMFCNIGSDIGHIIGFADNGSGCVDHIVDVFDYGTRSVNKFISVLKNGL